MFQNSSFKKSVNFVCGASDVWRLKNKFGTMCILGELAYSWPYKLRTISDYRLISQSCGMVCTLHSCKIPLKNLQKICQRIYSCKILLKKSPKSSEEFTVARNPMKKLLFQLSLIEGDGGTGISMTVYCKQSFHNENDL